MPPVSLIRKNGKRYVKLGKKRIKVDKRISERELIKWMIMHFRPRRKGKKKSKDEFTLDKTAKPIIPIVGVSSSIGDSVRIQAREAKDELDKVKKEVREIQEEVKKELKEQKQLPAPVRPALMPPSTPRTSSTFTHPSTFGKLAPPPPLPPYPPIAATTPEKKDPKKETKQEKRPVFPTKGSPAVYTQGQADKVLESQAEIEKLVEIRSAKKLELENKVAADIQHRITTLTVEDLCRIDGIEKSQYRKHYGNKENMAEELIKLDKFPMEQWKRELIDKKYSAEANDVAVLGQQITEKKMELKHMVGRGTQGERGLSDAEINIAMKGSEPEYLGCIAADEMRTLKPKEEKRICWIMNTDKRGLPGTHWVAVLIDARPHGTRSVEYYDPLGDRMPETWWPDLKKIIKAVNGDNTYLKYRENTIADQSDTSNNCGPFCIHFLKARLSGQSFAKATAWDKLGEGKIVKWRPYPKLWISSQSGEGLRDIYEKVKANATRIMARVKETLGGPRSGPSPNVRAWVEKFGSLEIDKLYVCKKPIMQAIADFANGFSKGQLQENMDRQGYEKLMHLYMIVYIRDGPTIKIEKNQVVEIKPSDDAGKQYLQVTQLGKSTVKELLDDAEKRVGALYSPSAKTVKNVLSE